MLSVEHFPAEGWFSFRHLDHYFYNYTNINVKLSLKSVGCIAFQVIEEDPEVLEEEPATVEEDAPAEEAPEEVCDLLLLLHHNCIRFHSQISRVVT